MENSEKTKEQLLNEIIKLQSKVTKLENSETILKQTKKELKINEFRLNEAQRLAKVGNWDLDLITNTLHWSDETYRIFNLKPQQFGATYEAFLSNIHPDDREFVNKAYTESVKNKIPYDIVHRILFKNGIIKYVNECCETFYDNDGNGIRSIGTIQDITERHQAKKDLDTSNQQLRASEQQLRSANQQLTASEQQLRASNQQLMAGEQQLIESEKQLQTLIDAMPDYVCFKDGNGRWLKVNNAGIQIFQLEGINFVEKKDSELAELNSNLRGTFLTCEETDARVWEEGNIIHGEETITNTDGSIQIFDVTKVPVYHPSGKRKGIAILGHNITERKLAEEVLIKRMNELEIFNDATVNRELKILELKKEINDLLTQKGQKPKYEIPV